jgi:hypothetical protein
VQSLQRAIGLSPLDPLGWVFMSGIGFGHLFARQFEDAIEWVDRALQEQPRYTPAIRCRACALLGRVEEARDCIGQLLELQPGLNNRGVESIGWRDGILVGNNRKVRGRSSQSRLAGGVKGLSGTQWK